MDASDIVVESIRAMGEGFLARLPCIVVGLLVALVFFIAGRVVRTIIRLAGARTRLDPLLARLLGGLAAVFINILGLLIAAVVIFPTFRPGDLLAGLGITSVAVGFAFKDILQNWLAGVFILWRRPFQIGDEIRTREHEGTVEEINVRSTVLRTYDGRRVLVPSAEVYTGPIQVSTAYESRRIQLTVGVDYLASIDDARQLLAETVQGTSGVLRSPGPWIHVLELAPSEVRFAVYFCVEPRQANVLQVADAVLTAVKGALEAAHIDTPYPHNVVLFTMPPGRARATFVVRSILRVVVRSAKRTAMVKTGKAVASAFVSASPMWPSHRAQRIMAAAAT